MRPVPINDPEAVIEAFLDSEIALTTGVMPRIVKVSTEFRRLNWLTWREQSARNSFATPIIPGAANNFLT